MLLHSNTGKYPLFLLGGLGYKITPENKMYYSHSEAIGNILLEAKLLVVYLTKYLYECIGGKETDELFRHALGTKA